MAASLPPPSTRGARSSPLMSRRSVAVCVALFGALASSVSQALVIERCVSSVVLCVKLLKISIWLVELTH